MNKYKRYIPIVALILLALGVNLDQFGIDLKALSQGQPPAISQPDDSATSVPAIDSSKSRPKWTTTSPNINQQHIFHGEINRSGKPVGFHARPGGKDPSDARLVAVRDAPNRAGVYTATIAISDAGQWKEKFSSFFPDSLSHEKVINAILNAYRNSPDPKANPFEGPSGLGFSIQGYTSSRGGINTAFPVYVRSQ